MITLKKIEIYMSYNGDGDRFVRFGNSQEKLIINYEDWSLIESLIQDIRLSKRDLVSEQYLENINKKLEANCDNTDTIIELKMLVDSFI